MKAHTTISHEGPHYGPLSTAESAVINTPIFAKRHERTCEPPYDELLRCLENDWHIIASWDGLRKFWNIELTEEGVQLRDGKMANGTLTAERTCRIVEEKRTLRSMLHGEQEVVDEKCSECGGYVDVGFGVIRNYCPNCGARVIKS